MDNQQLEIVEKVCSNPYLLANIFKFLTCQEQIKLTKVCDDFHYIIINYIWKHKYKQLHVREGTEFTIVNVQPNECFTESDFRDFLYLNADNITELSFPILYIRVRLIIFNLDIKFSNLIELAVQHVMLTEEDLQHLSKIFPFLKKLCIKNCFAKNYKPLRIHDDLRCNIYHIFSTLQHLQIEINDEFQLRYCTW